MPAPAKTKLCARLRMNDRRRWAGRSGCAQLVSGAPSRHANGLLRCGTKYRRAIMVGKAIRVRMTAQQSMVASGRWMDVQHRAGSDGKEDLGFTGAIRCEWLLGRDIDNVGR